LLIKYSEFVFAIALTVCSKILFVALCKLFIEWLILHGQTHSWLKYEKLKYMYMILRHTYRLYLCPYLLHCYANVKANSIIFLFEIGELLSFMHQFVFDYFWLAVVDEGTRRG
jgi:hypothetical protein